jgi:hypothetical protein
MNLESKRPAGPLFHFGRDPDAWAIPDWAILIYGVFCGLAKNLPILPIYATI